MNAPLTHRNGFHLTPAQSRRLETIPDDCVVIAAEGPRPLIRQPGGKIMCLNGDGSMVRASSAACMMVEYRDIDLAFPRCG